MCREVLAEAGRWVAAGTVLGFVVALAAGRVAGTLLYVVAPRDPWSWAAAAVVLSIVLVGAAVRPAMRAARVDPMTALRSE